MSGIFGLFQLHNAPLAVQDLCAMHEAMAHWGPDGTDSWYDEHAGLGHCLLFNTPEAVHERLPHGTADRRLVITAEARLSRNDQASCVTCSAFPTLTALARPMAC